VKGYAIVEYKRGWKCHHNLDHEHHVSRFGDREWAWREPQVSEPAARSKPGAKPDARAGAGSEPAASSKPGANPDAHRNIDGENVPKASGASLDNVGQAAPAGSRSAASSTSAAEPESGPVLSPWSLSFCDKYFLPQTRIKRSIAEFNQGTYDVTRVSVAGAKKPNTIKFSVVAGSGRMFYIAHLQETGPIMVSVKNVFPPSEGDWSETLKCFRVYTSRIASTRTLSPVDMLSDKGEIEALGRSSLHAQACKDERMGVQTYHCGDTPYWVDVRHVVGVVRWAPMVYRSADSPPDFPDNYWSGCPEEADLIYVGQHFSQVK
jgi:hypothetical protein